MAPTDNLQKKQDKAKQLRQDIRNERARRESEAMQASNATAEKQLDNEIERLQAELDAEKALTAATKKAAPPVSDTTELAKREAASAQRVAESIETKKER